MNKRMYPSPPQSCLVSVLDPSRIKCYSRPAIAPKNTQPPQSDARGLFLNSPPSPKHRPRASNQIPLRNSFARACPWGLGALHLGVHAARPHRPQAAAARKFGPHKRAATVGGGLWGSPVVGHGERVPSLHSPRRRRLPARGVARQQLLHLPGLQRHALRRALAPTQDAVARGGPPEPAAAELCSSEGGGGVRGGGRRRGFGNAVWGSIDQSALKIPVRCAHAFWMPNEDSETRQRA